MWQAAYEELGKLNQTDNRVLIRGFKNIEEVQDVGELGIGNASNENVLGANITCHEVTQVVKALINCKSAGDDQIVGEILKYGGKTMKYLVWLVCEMIFRKKHMPDEWMKGLLYMLYKKDGQRDPLNYRGIGLLNIIAKVF